MNFVKQIRVFLQEHGFDAGHTATLFSILIALSYWKDFKNWDKTAPWAKGLARSAVFAAVVLSLISILRIIGIFSF